MVARHETVYYIDRMIAVKRSSFFMSNFAIDIDITRMSTHSRLTYFDKKVCPTIFFFFFFFAVLKWIKYYYE